MATHSAKERGATLPFHQGLGGEVINLTSKSQISIESFVGPVLGTGKIGFVSLVARVRRRRDGQNSVRTVSVIFEVVFWSLDSLRTRH
jgi:hypothetical protein